MAVALLAAFPLFWGRQPVPNLVALGLMFGASVLFIPVGLMGRRPAPRGDT